MASCKDCLSVDVCEIHTCYLCDGAGFACDDCEIHSHYGKLPSVENCEHFKDRNRFVELPCNVGNILYMLNRNKSNIQEMTLDKPDIRCHCVKDDEFSCCMPICNDKENGICAYRFHFDFSEIGKTVFLTREEAERALKERENNVQLHNKV